MSKAEKDHNDGQKDGANPNNTVLDSAVVNNNPFVSQDYRNGWNNAYEQKQESDNNEESDYKKK